MRGTKPCATGGGGYSTVFGFINQSEQSRFCEVFGRLLALHEQFVVMQTQMGDLVRFLAAKVSDASLPPCFRLTSCGLCTGCWARCVRGVWR